MRSRSWCTSSFTESLNKIRPRVTNSTQRIKTQYERVDHQNSIIQLQSWERKPERERVHHIRRQEDHIPAQRVREITREIRRYRPWFLGIKEGSLWTRVFGEREIGEKQIEKLLVMLGYTCQLCLVILGWIEKWKNKIGQNSIWIEEFNEKRKEKKRRKRNLFNLFGWLSKWKIIWDRENNYERRWEKNSHQNCVLFLTKSGEI